MKEEVLTKIEAAKYMKVSLRTLNRLLDSNEIPFYKLGSGKASSVRISKSAIMEYLERHEVNRFVG